MSDFSETWSLWTDFRKILKYKISWKFIGWEPIVPYGRTDGHTDMTKVIVTSRNFANAPKIALPKYILSRSYDRESSCQWRINFTLEFFTTNWGKKKIFVLSHEISQNIRHKLSTLKCMSVRSRRRDSTITVTILTGLPRFYSVTPPGAGLTP